MYLQFSKIREKVIKHYFILCTIRQNVLLLVCSPYTVHNNCFQMEIYHVWPKLHKMELLFCFPFLNICISTKCTAYNLQTSTSYCRSIPSCLLSNCLMQREHFLGRFRKQRTWNSSVSVIHWHPKIRNYWYKPTLKEEISRKKICGFRSFCLKPRN